ncbi:hypothetical protein ACLMJK_003547 [Lecanora helva]
MAQDDDQQMQLAIEQSILQPNPLTAIQAEDLSPQQTSRSAHTWTSPTPKPREERISIEQRIREIMLYPGLELPRIHVPRGDTWIFLDCPPQQPEQSDFDHTQLLKRYKEPILSSKATILRHYVPSASGFDLPNLFGPTNQFRTIRRRQLTSKMRENPRIKYVIDLTPPIEGEGTAYLITELSCTVGVRLWFMPQEASSRVLEYSPLRHRAAIERVLAALAGIDPKLDSCVKWFTTFAVANYFGLAKGCTDYFIRWLRAYPNSFFVEVCAEVSFRMADSLMNYDLCRDAFAILVGEEALDQLTDARTQNRGDQYSAFGRRIEKNILPEQLITRIEYASKRFGDRIKREFEEFAGAEMKWIEGLPEIQKLLSYGKPELSDDLLRLLKEFVRGAIKKILLAQYEFIPSPKFDRDGGADLVSRRSRKEVWSQLSPEARKLTRSFWLAIIRAELFKGVSNLDLKHRWYIEDTCYPEALQRVQVKDLNQLIYEGNKIFCDDENNLPNLALPYRTRPLSAPGPESLDGPLQDINPCTQEPSIDLLVAQSDVDPQSTWDSSSIRTYVGPQEGTTQQQTDLDVPGIDRPASQDDGSLGLENWWKDISSEPGGLVHKKNGDLQVDPDTQQSQAPVRMESPSTPARTRFFDLGQFFMQARAEIQSFAERKLRLADYGAREAYDINITNTLVCLEESEWKYLPLWAGGLDDDTGGVFNEELPVDDLGFSAPGPHIHTLLSATSSDGSESEFEMVKRTYTEGTSSVANNGSHASTLSRNGVYAVDSLASQSSDDFDMIAPLEHRSEQGETQEWLEAAEAEAAQERIKYGQARVVDKTFADLDSDVDTVCADDSASLMSNDNNDDDDDLVVI